MILSLDDLITQLDKASDPHDAKASDALWIRFSSKKTHRTVEYRTADDNTIVHVYLDESDSLVGIEIFP